MRGGLVIIMLFSSLAGCAMSIQSITCEGRLAPLGLATQQPHFSWRLSADEPGQRQTAYQLQISAAEQELPQEKNLAYDSGKRPSDQSTFVPADAFAPASRQRYFWRVRVWDKNDIVSEWSEPAWFEMGLMQQSDWSAKWLSAPTLFDWRAVDGRRKKIAKDAPPELPEAAPIFRKEFSLDKKIASARVYVSGLGYYELLLNGKKVGDRLLDPAFTRYDKRVLYAVYDVTEQLKCGANALGLMLGRGWYDMSSRGVWGFDHAPWRADPTFILQLEATFKDGSVERIISDDSWSCAPGPITFTEIRQGEWVDARRDLPGWATPGFDDTDWFPVRTVRGPEGRLTAMTMPPAKVRQTFPPKSIKHEKRGVYVVDFGQNMAGFVRLRVQGKAGTTITLTYGEKLKDGLVDQSNIDGLVASAPFQTDKYTLKGDGVEMWQPRFVYHGFQYVEIHGFPGEPTADNLTAVAVNTSFAQTGEFSCSNELLNSIQHNTLWSYMNNFVGYPTDCPQREKNGWTGDAQLAAEAGLFNFDARTAYLKWMRDMADEQKPSGEIAAIIPTGGWGYYWGNGPAWDSAFLLIPWYVCLYTGDVRIIEENYEQMKRYVDFLTREKSKTGIVAWGLGDWCPEKTKTPAEITSTAYYFVDAGLIAKFARILEKPDDAQKYTELAKQIRTAFLKKFVDLQNGGVGNNSQTALSCALYQELVTGDEAAPVIDRLLQVIRKNDGRLDFGILGSKYAPNALSDFGHAGVAYAMINRRDYPGWGHWVELGATTLWENWDGGSSRSHIMFGDVSAWFYKNIGGIQPDPAQPGFKHFFIRPYFAADLQWAKAGHETMYGKIKSEWTRKEGVVLLNISIPVNTTATVVLGGETKLCDAALEKYVRARLSNGTTIFSVPSGKFCFQVKEDRP